MTSEGLEILRHLRRVSDERSRRRDDLSLLRRVLLVKSYQHARLARTYADFLESGRYGGPARFFLDDLYGPFDFAERDAQVGRVVPGLVRLFPRDVVQMVCSVSELHALSEELDSRLAQALDAGTSDTAALTAACYVRCWQEASTPAERERQIALMLDAGAALDRLTTRPLLRRSLQLMRSPARAIGLGALQSFVEAGFDAFAGMGGAADFLATVARRERTLAASLFRPEALAWASLPHDRMVAACEALGQLP